MFFFFFLNRNPSKTEPVPIGRPSSPLSMASTLDSERSLKQKYSITTHPRLPIVLCSDGYMVTALQMTNLVTSHDIAALSLVETNRKMKLIIDKFSLNVSDFLNYRFFFDKNISSAWRFQAV